VGIRPNLAGRSLTAFEVARSDQHNEAVFHELLCDLKTDSLIGPGDQCDGFVRHSNLLVVLRCSAQKSFLFQNGAVAPAGQ
jgi:hypothetical protein